MFLIRLIYLSSSKPENNNIKRNNLSKLGETNDIETRSKNDAIDQIKSLSQEKKIKLEIPNEIKTNQKTSITSFHKLLDACIENKEMRLKYELEKNVNLISFEKNRVEISFNDNLDKNFVKDISLKLFEWTGQRWIITLSKKKGEISIKEKEEIKKNDIINNAKDSELFKMVLNKFSDANLIDVIPKKEKEE